MSLTITKGINKSYLHKFLLSLIILSYTEMVDDFVKIYPNLETVYLENILTIAYNTDDNFRIDEECLNGIRFKRLT